MNILDRIVADKRVEVSLKMGLVSVSYLEASGLFERSCTSMSKAVARSKSGIIAEHKRRSPSRDVINNSLKLPAVVTGYTNAGVSGISVLTDGPYFGGALEDLLLARASVNTSLLRKEFIISEYQIIEAKAHGADVILLIAAILSRPEIEQFSTLAKSLGMEVLLEVHDGAELEKAIMPSLDMIGVNNRNLKTFEVSLNTSRDLITKIPSDFIKISESGLSEIAAVKDLQSYGFQGFLVGENFMKTNDPGAAALDFISKIEA
ncbi:MAG: indole-3-glycerol phosphate synthase TrpC [Flavobacteriaceae bacterium]|tara:strand:- start:2292 stop:3077 length:786 start_codon:yes stop_codon:yes gene_type:complete